jgi:outer membrane protein W
MSLLNSCRLAFLLFISSFLLLPFVVSAQDSGGNENGNVFGFRSAGVNLGWYNPSMDYWNDQYFPAGKWENSFKGAMIYTGFIEINIIKNLRVKASGAYWMEKVGSGAIKVGEVNGTEQITTSLTILSLDALYRFSFLTFAGISPYAGVGGSYVMIQNKFLRQPNGYEEENYTNQGQDMLGTLTLGLEKVVAQHFGIAIDFRYVIGNYTQEMKDTQGTITSHPVSLTGPQIGINLSYILR